MAAMPVTAAIEIAVRLRACEHYAEAGMPNPQLPGPQAVVGEQEVPHRMGLAGLCPSAVGRTELVHPFVMRPLADGPVVLVEQAIRHRRAVPDIRHRRAVPDIRHGAPCPGRPRQRLRPGPRASPSPTRWPRRRW